MFEDVLSFIDRNQNFILTTHDSPDADGIGAQMVLASVLKDAGKDFRIINSDPIPESLLFLETDFVLEEWDAEAHTPLLENSALMIVDTADEFHIGCMRKVLPKVKEVFVFDHHESGLRSKLAGFVDSTASSAAEIAIELACRMGTGLDPQTATAAYTGIVFDSGFFAYPKTTIRTFNAAIKTLEWGADPNYVYRQLMENSTCSAILLQKHALSNLEFHENQKIAVLTLRKEDLEKTGAQFEDADHFVNIPLKAKEVEVSLIIKERPTGEMRCSLRSKGMVNVSKVAQEFGGGGHVTAAGFKCSLSMEETLLRLLANLKARLNS